MSSPSQPDPRSLPSRGLLARRQFLARAGASGLAIGLGAAAADATAAPAAKAASFGYVSSGGCYTVTTGAGLAFRIHQSTGGMTSLNFNGTELQPSGTNESHVESGLPNPTVSVRQTGNYIIITASTTTWYGSGTLLHYYVAVNGQNNVYMATYVGSGAGELRWIQYLNRGVLTSIYTPSDVNGGTAIESTDIDLVNGQTRSKYYSNRQAMNLTVRGVTGSGIGVYMAYGTRESSSGGPFFRDIEQQGTSASVEVYNYMWSGHNDTEAQRLGVLYGPYALMVAGTSTPAAPDMSFMYSLGLSGAVGSASARVRGRGRGRRDQRHDRYRRLLQLRRPVLVRHRNERRLLQPRDEAGPVSSRRCTRTSWPSPPGTSRSRRAPPSPARTSTRRGSPRQARCSASGPGPAPRRTSRTGPTSPGCIPPTRGWRSWGPVTYTVGSSAVSDFPAYQWKEINNPTTVRFTLSSSQVAARTVRIGITAAYAGGRPQITVNSWTSPAPAASSQPNSRSLTIGTYRGNNAVYTYNVPASAFVVGTNTMVITVISGSAGLGGYLSPGISYDCVEMY